MDDSKILWAILGLTAVVDAIWLRLSGMRVSFGSGFVSGMILLICLNQFYTRFRSNERIAATTRIFAQMISLTCAVMILSFLAAAAKFPLVDSYLATADKAMGFDWLSFFYWTRSHPAIDATFDVVYASSIPQITILLIVLCATKRFRRANEFALLYTLTLLIIVALSLVLPAAGAWAHYGVAELTSAYYLPDFYALRDSTMRTIEISKANGIVQFPSFHAALGLILIICSRHTFLFRMYLPLNLIMIVSSLTSGGHHLVDVIAGLAITIVVALVLGALTVREQAVPYRQSALGTSRNETTWDGT